MLGVLYTQCGEGRSDGSRLLLNSKGACTLSQEHTKRQHSGQQFRSLQAPAWSFEVIGRINYIAFLSPSLYQIGQQ